MTRLEVSWGETIKIASTTEDTFSMTLDQMVRKRFRGLERIITVRGAVSKTFYGSGLYEQYIRFQEQQLEVMKRVQKEFEKFIQNELINKNSHSDISDIQADVDEMFFTYNFWTESDVDKIELQDNIEDFFITYGFKKKTLKVY